MDILIFDFLKKQLGLKTDPANPAGSLHAKVTEMRNTIIGTELPKYQKPRGAIIGSASVSSTTYVDLINVSGRGEFYWATMYRSGYETGGALKLIVDGVTVCEESATGTSRYCLSPVGMTTSPYGFAIPFKTSLVLQGRHSGGANTPFFVWCYSKE